MKVFFDTEFTGLHPGTTLISIGCVAEDGRTFYAELTDFNVKDCDEWIRENVIANLSLISLTSNDAILGHSSSDVVGFVSSGNSSLDHATICGDTAIVREHLIEWLKPYSRVELVSDVCYFDMVLFVGIFGHSFSLPDNVSASCHDINQDIADFMDCAESIAFDTNREDLAKQFGFIDDGEKHNALHDALIIKAIYEGIKDYKMNIEG